MPTVFFTGFPGFLGTELLPRVLARDAMFHATCLVQPKFMELARLRVREIEGNDGRLAGRIRLVEGDITLPGLGLSDPAKIAEDVVEIFHLAAIYDLSVSREMAMRINVAGTREVLDFARSCAALRRLQYVSTCYVSGRYPGIFRENQLEEGQKFNNAYEESKYLAEVEVQRSMRSGLPTTIYRPAIVVGDSRTGHTQKLDGPYFAIQWLLRQRGIAIVPVVGDPLSTRFNMVPSDFIVEAIAFLSGEVDAAGRVFHLADPAPLTVDQLLRELARATDRQVIRLPLGLRTAKGMIARVPGVYRIMRIPASSLDYMVHPTRYDTAGARELLDPEGIRVPAVSDYIDRLVDFARDHLDLGAGAMS